MGVSGFDNVKGNPEAKIRYEVLFTGTPRPTQCYLLAIAREPPEAF